MEITRRDLFKLGVVAAATAAGGALSPLRVRAQEDPAQFFDIPEIGANGFPALQEPPPQIVDNGLIHCGLFKSPARRMNLLDSNMLGGSAVDQFGLPRLLEWVGVGMVHPDWFFGFIIVDAKAGCLGVFYAYCRRDGFYFSHDMLGLRKWVHVADSTWDDSTAIHYRSYNMEVTHRLEQGFHRLAVDIGGFKKPPVTADITWHEDLAKVQPMVSLSPHQDNGFAYTHKAPMPTGGAMTIGDEKLTFDPGRDLTLFEEIKICSGAGAPSGIRWNMFGGGGFDPAGRSIAIATGSSPQKSGLYWTENCIWVDGQLTNVGPVDFEVNPKRILDPWHVHDRHGRLDINVLPEGGKTIDMQPFLGIYHQKCGSFSGTLVDAAGAKHEVKDFYGAGEYADVL